MSSTMPAEQAKAPSAALAILQRIGRSLMMPIAVLPAAAILLRLGQPDLLGAIGGWEQVANVVGQAGNALFELMPLLFAVGVAIGFAKRADGSTALAAVVGYLVFDRVSKVVFFAFDGPQGDVGTRVTTYAAAADPSTRVPAEGDISTLEPAINWGAKNPTDVLGGIVIGLVAALLWQRYYRIKLPTWLGFFGGRRFVPIITALAGLILGVAFGFLWPTVGGWINSLGEWIMTSGWIGAGAYGIVNRLLLPFGLHHVVNSVVWFIFGTFEGPDGVVHGEINRYFAGDPTAGGFLSGFFPVLMFGLPAAALAMWRAAHPSQRAAVGGIMISGALTAFVTGITEPIEFAFIFIAPMLFVVHVVLTGISMAILNALDAHLGFGFSAGLIDMLLNATKSNTTGLALILGMGVLYFALYYVIFYFLITRLNIATPGREPIEEGASIAVNPDVEVPIAAGDSTPAAEPQPEPRPKADGAQGDKDGTGT
ncbi:PTS system N-acetylglucosamine-specific IIC component [Murinocardiopsis flavida]|uniref:PTS system N-acetylglucosamine-specific IIC component n=1 Tax=Murinocardiopsis flavida TaxID=645275 RepID=A0A2P8DIW7_9ACTN|nr:PTS transporter subunit EIIC [Murinocardiopsis flavida]PSK97128.1 PTS system N-acetylglucosamine-specific IIC component [Murinocardiopsis flavida]